MIGFFSPLLESFPFKSHDDVSTTLKPFFGNIHSGSSKGSILTQSALKWASSKPDSGYLVVAGVAQVLRSGPAALRKQKAVGKKEIGAFGIRRLKADLYTNSLTSTTLVVGFLSFHGGQKWNYPK